MMFTLGRGLVVIHDPAEPYVTAIGRTLFPFVLIYLGWNLYTEDLREVLRADAQRLADAGDAMNAGSILDCRSSCGWSWPGSPWEKTS
jgi:hypothetical protein